jgi:hypothetical protein
MISLPLTQEQKVWAQRAALNAGYLFQEMLNAVERPPTADPPEGEEWFEKKPSLTLAFDCLGKARSKCLANTVSTLSGTSQVTTLT